MKIPNFLETSNGVNITEQAYAKAIEVLKQAVRPQGFFASGLKGGYEAVWARDSMITTLGAALAGRQFQSAIKNSLDLLSQNQSDLGQIPNCVGSYNLDRGSKITFNTVDSNLWYLIGHKVYGQAYHDFRWGEKYMGRINRALLWLKFQDPNEDKTLAQQPTMDWQDAFPHKYGRTINTHALYYSALKFWGEEKTANLIKEIINGRKQKYLSLYDQRLGYYLPWAWKNHDGDREQEQWFDSLGNILAVVTGLATPKIANRILNYIDKEKINRPYPLKAIWPPLKPGDKAWHSYFSKCDAREAYHYLNAGVWPCIGGFYIAALVKMKQFKKAEAELVRLAEGVMQKLKIREMKTGYEFNEWLDGRTGEPKGEPYQTWSAGAYLYAYECVKRKKVLFF